MKTPFESCFGKFQEMNKMKVLTCQVHAHIHKTNKKPGLPTRPKRVYSLELISVCIVWCSCDLESDYRYACYIQRRVLSRIIGTTRDNHAGRKTGKRCWGGKNSTTSMGNSTKLHPLNKKDVTERPASKHHCKKGRGCTKHSPMISRVILLQVTPIDKKNIQQQQKAIDLPKCCRMPKTKKPNRFLINALPRVRSEVERHAGCLDRRKR